MYEQYKDWYGQVMSKGIKFRRWTGEWTLVDDTDITPLFACTVAAPALLARAYGNGCYRCARYGSQCLNSQTIMYKHYQAKQSGICLAK